MALIDIKTDPSPRELRQFAGIWLPAFCGLVGWLAWSKARMPTAAVAIWASAGFVAAVGIPAPRLVRPIFVGWMVAAWPIGWTISHLLLAVVFYLVMTPIGLVMRLLGRDPLDRRFDPAAKTYWVEHNPSSETERYFRQF